MSKSANTRQIEWARNNVPSLAFRGDKVLRVVVQRAIDESRSKIRILMIFGFILGFFASKAVEDFAFAESLSRGASLALSLLSATCLGAVTGMICSRLIRKRIENIANEA